MDKLKIAGAGQRDRTGSSIYIAITKKKEEENHAWRDCSCWNYHKSRKGLWSLSTQSDNGHSHRDIAQKVPESWHTLGWPCISGHKKFKVLVSFTTSKCLSKFDSDASAENLQCELSSFALQRERLKMSPLDEYEVKTMENESEDEQVEIQCKKCSSCKECLLCCYQILRRFNQISNAYNLLGLAYQFLLTLSLRLLVNVHFQHSSSSKPDSEPSCHKSIWKLLCWCQQKRTSSALLTQVIIDKVAEKSELFSKLLL